jgi:hypothetical protein
MNDESTLPLPKLPDLMQWQAKHQIMAFIATDSKHMNFSIQKDEHVLLIAGPAEIFGKTSAYDVTFGDLMEHTGRQVFEAKPDGEHYLEFVKNFGEDCADDLMSIIRGLNAFDDSLTD